MLGPVDDTGWVAGVTRVESPFHDERPAGSAIELLVVHNISLPPGRFGSGDVLRLFTGTLDTRAHPFFAALAGQRVSAHFFIDRQGGVTQLVSCRRRAWHAGASQFEGRSRCNDFSLGVELEGTDFSPYTDAQYVALARLVAVVRAAYPLRAVRGHSDIAPGRKTDPGPFFDWSRLATLAPQYADLLPPARP
ncbi:MAG TPA: 1,6-anhydro-N-acetylmuramyl-L-alanine amidase AmpD [Burkholderiaceae bacterium]|jgi:AmpD protein|nr:1,6-anhydro-N-acetylmuramyl-L-alanine amidase AmpD [Burkholderiaceae bacterium]